MALAAQQRLVCSEDERKRIDCLEQSHGSCVGLHRN